VSHSYHTNVEEIKRCRLFMFYRNLEDFVTWIDTSAIKKHVLEYNNEVRIQFSIYYCNYINYIFIILYIYIYI